MRYVRATVENRGSFTSVVAPKMPRTDYYSLHVIFLAVPRRRQDIPVVCRGWHPSTRTPLGRELEFFPICLFNGMMFSGFSSTGPLLLPGLSAGQIGSHTSQYDVLSHLRQQILRLVLDGTQQTHTHLKRVALSSLLSDLKGHRGNVKGYFDVAVVSLLEEGLMVRCGSGNWSRYGVPAEMVGKARVVAYQGFEGDCEDVIGTTGASGTVGAPGTAGAPGTVSNNKRELSLSPLRVTGGTRGVKKRKRRSFCSGVPMSP